MAKDTGAARLHERFQFEKRKPVSDGRGNTLAEWELKFRARAERSFFRGTEKVQEAASTGLQRAILKIRNFSAAREVDTGWRAVNARTGTSYNILAVEPQKSRQYIEFVVQSGGADG